MSAFRVGQRVKVLQGAGPSVVGLEGVVFNPHDPTAHNFAASVGVRFDREIGGDNDWWFAPHLLAPLTDPLADAFVERIKKIAREPAPMVKEKA